MNGAAGDRRYGRSSTLATRNSAPSRAATSPRAAGLVEEQDFPRCVQGPGRPEVVARRDRPAGDLDEACAERL